LKLFLRRPTLMALVLTLFVVSPPSFLFAETSTEYHLRVAEGVAKLDANDLGLALQRFDEALALEPKGVEAHYYLGVTHARAHRDTLAEKNFQRAIALDRSFLAAHFDLGVLYFRIRADEKALAAFERVEHIDPERARVHYYQGMILRRMGREAEGEAKLRRAVALDPNLGAEVHFRSGAEDYESGRLGSARVEFQAVVSASPEGALAESARQFIEKIDSRSEKEKRWTLSGSFGLQYDDNVVLAPDQSTAASAAITQSESAVGVVYLLGRYRWLKQETWTGDLEYSFYQNLHEESALDDFNIQDHHLVLSGGRRMGPYELDLAAEFQIATLGGEAFLSYLKAGPNLSLRHSDGQISEAAYAYGTKSFENIGPLFLNNADRDVKTHQIGFVHYFLFKEKGNLYGGYRFEKEIAGDSPAQDDWAFDGHRITAGVVLPAWREITLAFEAEGLARDFKNLNQLAPQLRREDEELLLLLTLTRPLGAHLDLSAQILHQNNDSNIALFSYTRTISGLILTAHY